jgi:hypothetical protein
MTKLVRVNRPIERVAVNAMTDFFELDFLTYAAGASQARRMALISAGVSWSG